jgi:hypothetical protein
VIIKKTIFEKMKEIRRTEHGDNFTETNFEMRIAIETLVEILMRHNRGHVYSHRHDDGFKDDVGQDDIGQDDVGHGDEGIDVLWLMCCYKEETSVLIILRRLIKHRETFFTRSVNGVIRNTRCYG